MDTSSVSTSPRSLRGANRIREIDSDEDVDDIDGVDSAMDDLGVSDVDSEESYTIPAGAPDDYEPVSRGERARIQDMIGRQWALREEVIRDHHLLFPIEGYHEIKAVRIDAKKYALAKDKIKLPSLKTQITQLEEKKEEIKVLKWTRHFGIKEGQTFRRNDPIERKMQEAMLHHHIEVAKAVARLPNLEKLIIVDINRKYDTDVDAFYADFSHHMEKKNGRTHLKDLSDSIPFNDNVFKFVFETNIYEFWKLALSERHNSKYGTQGGTIIENFKMLDEKFPNVEAVKFKIYGEAAHPDYGQPFFKLTVPVLVALVFECEEGHTGALAYDRDDRSRRLERILSVDRFYNAMDFIDYDS